nr:uncharacterized protein LOC106841047 isoform X4 [Equus asinus]
MVPDPRRLNFVRPGPCRRPICHLLPRPALSGMIQPSLGQGDTFCTILLLGRSLGVWSSVPAACVCGLPISLLEPQLSIETRKMKWLWEIFSLCPPLFLLVSASATAFKLPRARAALSHRWFCVHNAEQPVRLDFFTPVHISQAQLLFFKSGEREGLAPWPSG